MVAALGELARTGGTLYDIGAHIGVYSCAWLKLGGEQVEAFEPAPYNLDVLRATLKRNGLAGRVRVHAFALGDRNGEADLVAGRADVGASSAAYLEEYGGAELPPGVQFEALPNSGRIKVPVHTLDALFTESELRIPTVLKLDIEGAEAAALAGAEGVLARWQPAVLCEVHSVDAALAIADHLAHLDYGLTVLGKNGPHVACLWQTSQQYRSPDAQPHSISR
jgi:FkbM family methyltransferase